MATWAAAVVGLIASMTAIIYGALDTRIIVVAGVVGAAWSAYTLASSFFQIANAERSALVHAVAGVALLIAIGLETSGWTFLLVLIAGHLIVCAAVYAADHRDVITVRITRRRRDALD